MVGTRGRHDYVGEKRKLTALQQKRTKKQAVETHLVPKQRTLQTSITTRVSPGAYKVQWLFTVTPRHPDKLPLSWGLSRDTTQCHAEREGLGHKKWIQIQLFHYYLEGVRQVTSSLRDSFLSTKGFGKRHRPAHLTGLSEQWNETVQSEYWVNYDLQTDSICRANFRKMFINIFKNCFRILNCEWSELLLYGNTNNKRHLPLRFYIS